MSLFFRKVEKRAVTFQDVWGSGGPLPMAEVSPERALRLAPVYAATRLIADDVSSLPIHQFRRLPDDTRQRMELSPWLSNPSSIGTPYDWKFRCMTSLLLRGNAFGLRLGSDDRVEWMDPRDITVDDSNYFAPVYYWRGRRVERPDIVHIPAYVVPGKIEGLSPLGAFSLAVQLGVSASEFGRDWFHNRTLPGSTLKNTAQVVTPEQASVIKERYRASLRSGDVFVHGSDWEFTPVSMTPQDSQLVEMLKMSATQVAAVYGVPPEEIGGEAGGSLTYNTVEQNQIRLTTRTLRPWLVRFEDALSALLPSTQYVKFNVDSMIRTDLVARYRAHLIARQIGLNNVDELRAVEDLPPLPDGQGQDYTPLRAAGRREASDDDGD